MYPTHISLKKKCIKLGNIVTQEPIDQSKTIWHKATSEKLYPWYVIISITAIDVLSHSKILKSTVYI